MAAVQPQTKQYNLIRATIPVRYLADIPAYILSMDYAIRASGGLAELNLIAERGEQSQAIWDWVPRARRELGHVSAVDNGVPGDGR